MRRKQDSEDGSASLTIEDDSLLIGAGNEMFRLPREAVDQLVSSLLISGFGPQTIAQFNTVLTFRDLKNEQAVTDTGRHRLRPRA